MGQEDSTPIYKKNHQNSPSIYKPKITKSLFEFLYVIGRGGFGKVWKVKYKKNNKKYALKEMSKLKILEKKSEKSIKNERDFLSQLHHPFIVNMMCTFQDYNNLYLVMDLYTGGDLRYHICHQKQFLEEQAKFFCACVILGLEYIHKNNIIHRDIKPENLVLDKNGYLAITDFGVAKKNCIDNSSETSGTPGYMAPEVLCAQNHSFCVDFFAIGVMCYEFMIGHRPYLGKNRKEIKDAVLAKQVYLHRKNLFENGWSLDSGNFINKLLYRKPNKRLGYNGIFEIKNHPWFNDFKWDDLYKKIMISPFIPKNEDNFDKKYCGVDEIIDTKTKEKYSYYLNSDKYKFAFNNYTFIKEEENIDNKFLYMTKDIGNIFSNNNTTSSTKGTTLSNTNVNNYINQDNYNNYLNNNKKIGNNKVNNNCGNINNTSSINFSTKNKMRSKNNNCMNNLNELENVNLNNLYGNTQNINKNCVKKNNKNQNNFDISELEQYLNKKIIEPTNSINLKKNSYKTNNIFSNINYNLNNLGIEYDFNKMQNIKNQRKYMQKSSSLINIYKENYNNNITNSKNKSNNTSKINIVKSKISKLKDQRSLSQSDFYHINSSNTIKNKNTGSKSPAQNKLNNYISLEDYTYNNNQIKQNNNSNNNTQIKYYNYYIDNNKSYLFNNNNNSNNSNYQKYYNFIQQENNNNKNKFLTSSKTRNNEIKNSPNNKLYNLNMNQEQQNYNSYHYNINSSNINNEFFSSFYELYELQNKNNKERNYQILNMKKSNSFKNQNMNISPSSLYRTLLICNNYAPKSVTNLKETLKMKNKKVNKKSNNYMNYKSVIKCNIINELENPLQFELNLNSKQFKNNKNKEKTLKRVSSMKDLDFDIETYYNKYKNLKNNNMNSNYTNTNKKIYNNTIRANNNYLSIFNDNEYEHIRNNFVTSHFDNNLSLNGMKSYRYQSGQFSTTNKPKAKKMHKSSSVTSVYGKYIHL